MQQDVMPVPKRYLIRVGRDGATPIAHTDDEDRAKRTVDAIRSVAACVLDRQTGEVVYRNKKGKEDDNGV